VPSVEKLFALTGFKPQTPLTEIIDRVTNSLQAKSERTPELQVPVKTNVARQGSQQLS
jgi:hypothetical protein